MCGNIPCLCRREDLSLPTRIIHRAPNQAGRQGRDGSSLLLLPLLRMHFMLLSEHSVLQFWVQILHQAWITTPWSESVMLIQIQVRNLSTKRCGQHAKQNMIEDDENSLSANEVGLVLLPEKFQTKKNIQHFQNSRLFQEKNPKCLKNRWRNKCPLSSIIKKRWENKSEFSNELCSSGLCFRVRQNYKI